VVKIIFHVPGLEDPIPGACSTGVPVPAGGATDMFAEMYGDFEFAMFNSDGARGTGEDATATVTYRDNVGRFSSITVTGPVLPGHLPTVYTGGSGRYTLTCAR
jgi:hypothetical protein